MKTTKGKGPRSLAGQVRDPRSGHTKIHGTIIPRNHKKRYSVRFTADFWNGVKVFTLLVGLPVIYMLLQLALEVN